MVVLCGILEHGAVSTYQYRNSHSIDRVGGLDGGNDLSIFRLPRSRVMYLGPVFTP